MYIKSVEMENFMCHVKKKIELRNCANFIIGHNGSGKSAIIAAIMVAFGATPSSVDRGKLASLCKKGMTNSRVTVVIDNSGDSRTAFRPAIYGSEIKIIRQITPTSYYHLRGEDDKQKAEGAAEIRAMLSFFNIFVNNPMYFMTQNEAKKFIAEQKPPELYELLQEGLQITPVARNIETIDSNLKNLLQIYRVSKDSLEVSKKSIKVLEHRIENLEVIRSSRNTVEVDKVWRTYADHRDILDKQCAQLEQLTQKYDSHAAEKETNELELEKTQKKIIEVEKESEGLRDVADNTSTRLALDNEITLINQKIMDDSSLLRTAEDEIDNSEYMISLTNTAIADVAQKEQGSELQSQLVAKEAALQEVISNLQNVSRQITSKSQLLRDRDIEKGNIDDLVRSISDELHRRRRDKIAIEQRMKGGTPDNLAAYHHSYRIALDRIKEATAKGLLKGRVIGPLSSFIRIRSQYREYWKILESTLNRHARSFLIERKEDRQLLSGILREVDCRANILMLRSNTIIDTSAGEPNKKFLTIDRALVFDEPLVRSALIIEASIEKIILVSNPVIGNKITERGFPENCSSVLSQDGFRIGARAGKSTTTVYLRDNMGLLSLDSADQESTFRSSLSNLDEMIQKLEIRLDTARRDSQQAEQQLRNMEREIRTLKNEVMVLNVNKQELEVEINSKQEEIRVHSDNSNLDMLRKKLAEYEDTLAKSFEKKKQIMLRKAEHTETLKNLDAKLAEINDNDQERRARFTELSQRRSRLAEKAKKYETRAAHAVAAMKTLDNERQELSKQIEVLKAESEKLFEAASKVGERPAQLSSAEEIAQLEAAIRGKASDYEMEDIEALKKTLREEEAKRRARKAEISRGKKRNKLIHRRKAELQRCLVNIRESSAARVTQSFNYFMERNNLPATLVIDHAAKVLEIRLRSVGNDDRVVSRDRKSLSGGEKSYVGLSLLLSIWKDHRSFIRCLDEFDVFMDDSVRSASFAALRHIYKSSKSQFIFVTPQGLPRMMNDEVADGSAFVYVMG